MNFTVESDSEYIAGSYTLALGCAAPVIVSGERSTETAI